MKKVFRCKCGKMLGKQKEKWYHFKSRSAHLFASTPILIVCPACGTVYLIETEGSQMKMYPKRIDKGCETVQCRVCDYLLRIPGKDLKVKCPRCNNIITNPSAYEKQTSQRQKQEQEQR